MGGGKGGWKRSLREKSEQTQWGSKWSSAVQRPRRGIRVGLPATPHPRPTSQGLQSSRPEGPVNWARGNQGGEGPGAAGEV